MKVRTFWFLAACALTLASLASLASPLPGATVAAAATPPPTPPPLPALPTFTPGPMYTQPPETPSPIPAPGALPPPQASQSVSVPVGKHRRGENGATPSPPPQDARKGLDGVWEVQIQSAADPSAIYTHFQLKQDQNALTGTYLDSAGKKFALAGSLDGKNVRVVVTLADGSTLVFTGTVDGTTDMLGTLTDAKGQTMYFTAAYRPKENFMDNINANPGLGNMSSGGIPPN